MLGDIAGTQRRLKRRTGAVYTLTLTMTSGLHTSSRRATAIVVALLAALMFSALQALPAAADSGQSAIHYTMTVDVDYERAFLNVDQAVRFTNDSDRALGSVVFNVPPAAFNAFTLSSAAVGEVAVKPSEDGAILDIPLPEPLASGETTVVTLRWWGQLPYSNGRYGAADGVLVLGDWYPMLAVLQNGLWERHQYMPRGDAYFSEVADYEVAVSAPPTVTIASSGQTISNKAGEWVFRAEDARDFALALSSRYQTLARKVDGVDLTVYYLPEQAEGAKSAMEITDQAMRWYAKRIGPYPFPGLAVVQVPNGDGQHTAQEHAALFLYAATSSLLESSASMPRTSLRTPGSMPLLAPIRFVTHGWTRDWSRVCLSTSTKRTIPRSIPVTSVSGVARPPTLRMSCH